YVLHQAALGSVPRSIKDPINTNSVNIDGFLNVLVASRDENIKRFVYAASSSTYGDSKKLPKLEDEIGKPLSPYAITKYANELYADVFATTYGMKCIGLRYFNVFGKRQDPDSAYSAVIPLWIKKLIKHESPTVNGDGSISRDFTYIDNVVQANYLAIQTENQTAFNTVYNTAYGEQNTLNELLQYLKELLSMYDSEIMDIEIKYGPKRTGDIEHSHASIEKARQLLNYIPKYSLRDGLKETINWYYENLS
ncbi:MAG: NAD-dependent epimerase/dehydratase family protein, partial [Ignavibacteria bacterium]|nr:NAD-dependent epimerase/dehydratase family protein [Ignavibacteria bacterium]